MKDMCDIPRYIIFYYGVLNDMLKMEFRFKRVEKFRRQDFTITLPHCYRKGEKS